jgi:squalene-hopene/tetraprenyl-beta-curcumene cyclase
MLCGCLILTPTLYSQNKTIELATQRPSKPQNANLSLINETRHSLEIAFTYLLTSQQPNGSWKNDPAITSLVVYSFMLYPEYLPDAKTERAIENAFNYLKQFVKPDGGIYEKKYRNYVTAVCLMAFVESNVPEYKSIITNAKNFLIKFQIDEGESISEKHPYYGGIGYGGDDRPDLSNTQIALDAIHAAENYEKQYGNIIPANQKILEKDEQELGLHWQKALIFLARCQNVKAVNKMPYATDDGGFIYETGHYKKERSHSYGSMTYAGVKSLLYAKVDSRDIRIQKAVAWIKDHYTLEENPGFGSVSLYYYYMTASKCLDALGQNVLKDSNGQSHHWRQELIQKIISLQHEDGYWMNANGRYWENIKDLATAYSIIAVKFALRNMH